MWWSANHPKAKQQKIFEKKLKVKPKKKALHLLTQNKTIEITQVTPSSKQN